MRLNRYLSQCGLGSRRGCEQIITEGRVSINGRQVSDLATHVEPEDRVMVDGRTVHTAEGIVIALHKPRGYICTRSDTHDRMTIYDLLPAEFQTLHHVGRLDKESEGLILLTNRGDLSHRLIHPSQGAEKEYEVVVDKPLDQAVMAKLVKGMFTEEGHAKAERAWMETDYRASVVLKQGLKRQIRLMFYQLGFEVERLVRTRIGWMGIRGMPKGGWRVLSAAEVERFFSKDGGGRPVKVVKPKKGGASTDSEDSEPETKAARPKKEAGGARGQRGGASAGGRSGSRGKTSFEGKGRATGRGEKRGSSGRDRSASPGRGRSSASDRDAPASGRGSRSSFTSRDKPARGGAKDSRRASSRGDSSSSRSSARGPARKGARGPNRPRRDRE